MRTRDQVLEWLSSGTDSYCHYVVRRLEQFSSYFFQEPPLADFAEYHTNWQLSLDGNLPGVERRHYRELAQTASLRIALKII